MKQVLEEEEQNHNNEDERSRMVQFSGSQDKGEEVQIFKEGKVEIFKGDKMKLFKADGMKFLYQLRMQVLKTVMR